MSANLPVRPQRTNTGGEEDAIPDEDASEVTKLFLERLQAYKHACGYLENYFEATEKMQNQMTKEYEKVLKTVSDPLKESHHFDQQPGGISGLFENIRTNTQSLANSHTETGKTLKGTVRPILERLHAEIKNKSKEISKGAGKGAKQVDKARDTTQKYIEQLARHTASTRPAANEDPYVLHRQVYHRLNKQIVEENANRQDMLTVQNQFSQFEAHIIQTFQDAITQFNTVVANQTAQTKALYEDVDKTTAQIPPDFEWNGFVHRNDAVLIDPNAPQRNIQNVTFPHQNHQSTQPLVAGSLDRKGKIMKSYSSAYYVITPARYLHEYKTDDDFAKDPVPENSLYLPDCVVGALDGLKFQIKGKDSSKGSIGNKFSVSHEYAFKAHSPSDAQNWHRVVAGFSGQSNSVPTSPTGSPVGKSATSAFPPTTGSAVSPTAGTTGATTTGTTGATTGTTTTTGTTGATTGAQHGVDTTGV